MKPSSSNRQEKQTYRTVDIVVKRLLPDFKVKVFKEMNNTIENFNRECETI